MASGLTERERTVLHYVVRDFIETATPIGSRYISRRHEAVLGLSSASIRNVMSDLEEMGLIGHPHPSAGRIPTDLGYRFYVDSLMELEKISQGEQKAIAAKIDGSEDPAEVLRECARLLGRISHQLCVVSPPRMADGTFEKLELIPLVGNRIMVIISIKSGLVRTIMMEVASEIKREKLEDLSRFLNQRLNGLTLDQIRESFRERVRDAQGEETGLIRLFIDSVDKLFVGPKSEKLHVAGTDSLIEQPEFSHPENFRSVIELISDEEMIIHVLAKSEEHPQSVTVTVGAEHDIDKMKPYSIVSTSYSIGEVGGTIGVIGPTRMPYSRLIPLVDFVAKTVSAMFSHLPKS
jgi:heat-inducible transcriptional repressor